MNVAILTDMLKRLGNHGNQTLEYIGVVLHKYSLADWKIYYKFNNTEQESFSVLNSDIHYRLYRELSEDLPIRMCDYSHSIMKACDNMRSLCQFPMSADYDIVEKTISGITCIPIDLLKRLCSSVSTIHSSFPAQFSPLIQLGIETDMNGKLQEIKYYLNLKTDYSVHPVLDEDLLKKLEILHGISVSEYESLFDTFDILRSNSYYPTFIGVNNSLDHVEYKLYFISSLFGRRLQNEYQAQNQSLISQLTTNKTTLSFLDALNHNHLWLEGIAVSFSDPDVLRLYWRELE